MQKVRIWQESMKIDQKGLSWVQAGLKYLVCIACQPSGIAKRVQKGCKT
jgi:hypothetical protein